MLNLRLDSMDNVKVYSNHGAYTVQILVDYQIISSEREVIEQAIRLLERELILMEKRK